ncbi:MAG TPA: hypothetical protein VIH42_03295 [Thermoguttaceae bacterium]
MTIGGWIIMISSVGFVTGLFAWSIARVLRTSHVEKFEHVKDVPFIDLE